jgi:type IV secretory pathway ATPase VirB11/archaellum biosynthesis ATPase
MVKAQVVAPRVVELMEKAIKNNENILICGPKHSGKTEILNASLPLLPLDASLVILQARDELAPQHVNVVLLNKESLGAEPTSETFILESIGPDWVVLEDLEMNDVKVMLELAVSGRQSIIATSSAADCQACLDRLLLELTMLYPALTHADRMRMLYSTLDMVLTLTRQPGGRPRVTRVTHLGLKDGNPVQDILFGD